MALSVKAYLNPETNQQEIRRFAIDEGASANFAYLRQKIEQVFPSVRGKVFKLFWKGKIIGFLLIRFARSISCEKCRVLCVLYQYKFHLKAVLLNRDRKTKFGRTNCIKILTNRLKDRRAMPIFL